MPSPFPHSTSESQITFLDSSSQSSSSLHGISVLLQMPDVWRYNAISVSHGALRELILRKMHLKWNFKPKDYICLLLSLGLAADSEFLFCSASGSSNSATEIIQKKGWRVFIFWRQCRGDSKQQRRNERYEYMLKREKSSKETAHFC